MALITATPMNALAPTVTVIKPLTFLSSLRAIYI